MQQLKEKLTTIATGELERSPELANQLLEILNNNPSKETLIACDLVFEITKAGFIDVKEKLDIARSQSWVGSHTSTKKAASSAENGKKGGRPRKDINHQHLSSCTYKEAIEKGAIVEDFHTLVLRPGDSDGTVTFVDFENADGIYLFDNAGVSWVNCGDINAALYVFKEAPDRFEGVAEVILFE